MKNARPDRRPRTGSRTPGDRAGGRALVAAFLLCLLAGACAVVEAPPGGPPDLTPPRLAAAEPESGSVALGPVRTLRLTFTEKMTRQPAESWLHFYPEQRIRHTDWKGAREAVVEFFDPLPADTVIVVEVAAALQDAHKVKGRESRRFPLATAAALPAGRLSGALVLGDSAVTAGVVELFPLAPDTLEYFQRPLLRRAVTDHLGHWAFDWLPVPGGPWLVRAFADGDGNLRPGDRDPQRLWPDTLSLSVDRAQVAAGVLTLYAAGTPGKLESAPFARRGWAGGWFGWAMVVADGDTGWVPEPTPARGRKMLALDPEAGGVLEPVPSGTVRVVVFADVDGDSLLGSVTGAALREAAAVNAAPWPDTLSAAAYLEPWWVVEGLVVPPGLAADLIVPVTPPALTVWTATDSTAAGADPTATAPQPKEP